METSKIHYACILDRVGAAKAGGTKEGCELKHRKRRHIVKGRTMWKTAAALCLSLLVGMSAGCGGQKEPEELPQQETGGYTSSDKALSELPEGSTVKQIFTCDDSVHLLTAVEKEDAIALQEWELRGDVFQEVTRDWLAGLRPDCESWADMQLVQNKSGTQYLFVRGTNAAGAYQGQLWRENGSEAVNITPEKWTDVDEQTGVSEYILGIGAFDDGTLSAVSYRCIDILDGADGTVLASEEHTVNYGETVLTDGENLYLLFGGAEGIEKRPGGRSANAETIAPPVSGMGEAALCVLGDGTLICAGAEGIFRYDTVKENWEKLLDGPETDFSLTTCWCMGMTALADGRIYALFQQEGVIRLVKYEYDPEAVRTVDRNLTIYTVWESSLLQQAAAMYHREHPEILISEKHIYSIEDMYSGKEPDYDQIYRQLNTELLSGEAPDILVLDGLDIDSYTEKGLLADIGGVVAPLEESGELLSNITGAYVQEDGSRYIVPLQFQITLAIGRDVSAEDMATLEQLSGFLAGQQESCLGPMTVEELVDQFYPYFCGEIVKDGQLEREALGRNLEYLKGIADNSGIVSAHAEGEKMYNFWNLPSKARIALGTGKGFRNVMFPMAVMNYVGGDFTAFENCFLPSLQVGISAKSEYRDTAEDFLRFALSQSIQDTDYNTGFPVNRASLEKQEKEDRSDVAAVTTITNSAGGEEMFEVDVYSAETAEKLADICKSLDRPAAKDAKIREELIAALPEYLDGTRTLEETLDRLESALGMYLAE